MRRFGFRPRYQFMLPGTSEVLEDRIRAQMRRNNPADLKLRRTQDLLVLRFPSHTSRIWTPQVAIELHEDKQARTRLEAVIGPSFRIWKFFRGALLGLTLLGCIGLVLAFLQWGNDGGAWGFYLMMVALAGGLFLYFLSEEGKRRSNDERELLMTFMDDALGTDLFLPLARKKADRLARRMA